MITSVVGGGFQEEDREVTTDYYFMETICVIVSDRYSEYVKHDYQLNGRTNSFGCMWSYFAFTQRYIFWFLWEK